MRRILFAMLFVLAAATPGHARHVHHHAAATYTADRPADCYRIPWCGCWLRHQFSIADRRLNLALNWLHVGSRAAGPAPGIVGVMRHHVFKVLAVVGPGRVLAISGNDGHAVRTRVRSTARVIGWRALN